jgi:hypothetical protein
VPRAFQKLQPSGFGNQTKHVWKAESQMQTSEPALPVCSKEDLVLSSILVKYSWPLKWALLGLASQTHMSLGAMMMKSKRHGGLRRNCLSF